MNTVAELLEALGGRPAVAEAVGLSNNSVTYWARRGRIPPEYWDELIRLAAVRRVRGVNHTLLLSFHTGRRLRSDKTLPEAEFAA